MEANICHIFFLIYLFAPVSNSLNFNDALTEKQFEELQPGIKNVQISTSKAFFRDDNLPYNGHMTNLSNMNSYSHHNKKDDYTLIVTTPEQSDIEGFTGELSLMVLKLAKEQGTVEVVVRRGNPSKTFNDTNIPERTTLPNSTHGIEKDHIFKTWKYGSFIDDGLSHGNRSIEIRLTNWTRKSSIYLIATAYSVGPSSSDKCPPSSWWGHSNWWDCQDPDDPSKRPHCISYDLTCDNLPNCAQQKIPNSDENCSVHIGVMEVLELIIYTLMAILLLLIVSALAKCFIRRHHIRSPLARGNARRHMEIRELFAAAQIVQRPANAPPTYEDAMKFVNDAFDNESITEDPPEYSTVPAPGEETCMSTPASPTETESSLSSPAAFMSPLVSPTGSSLSSNIVPIHGQRICQVPPEDAVKQVAPIEEDDNNTIVDTAEENSATETLNSDGATAELGKDGFEDNFIDIPLEELPKDPPAYSYIP